MNPNIRQTLARIAAAGTATIEDLIELECHDIPIVKHLGMHKASVMRQASRGDIDHERFMHAFNKAYARLAS